MRGQHTFSEAPGLEQGKAQQHRVPHARPDRLAYIRAGADTPYQDSVDRYADHNQKCLETEGEQRFEVVLPHTAKLFGHHRRHGDGGHAGDEINLDHAPKGDDEDADGERPHGNAHKERLNPQAQQWPKVHSPQPCSQVGDDGGEVNAGAARDHAGRTADYALCHVEYAHDDIPGVAHDQHSAGALEYPLEKHPGIAFSKHTLSLHGLSETAIAVQSPEDTLIDALEQQEREEMHRMLIDGLDSCLTPAQRRRLWLYCVDGLTVRQIAMAEGVQHPSIIECLAAAKKKLLKHIKNLV